MSDGLQTAATVAPGRRVRGRLRVPGDKSVSHRYALLAAIADGSSRLGHYAPGADCASTLACLERLGVAVERDGTIGVRIAGRGPGGLLAAAGPLDAGNSGSTLRMLSGVVAAHPFETILTGDLSLSRRPMRRIIEPLESMGARIASTDGCAPLAISGARLTAIDYTPPVASAQVKSAVLLAGLQASGTTSVREPAPTRDHTERALRAFGVDIEVGPDGVRLTGGQRPRAIDAAIPGDASSAAFWAAAAAALPGSDVEILDVGLNASRTGFLRILEAMGARVEVEVLDEIAGEPRGRLRVRGHGLRPVVLEAADVPAVIDELPVLGAAAVAGRGGLMVSGAGELRHKESDRIAALVAGIHALGGEATEREDGFEIGGGSPLAGGEVDAVGDHRLAMAFAVAALGATGPTVIRGAEAVDVSYPGFFDVLSSIVE